MLAGIPRQALELAGEIDDRRDFLVLAVHSREFVVLGQRLFERHADFERHLLGDPVHESVRMTEDPARVANDGLGRHRAVSDDLGHALAAVALRNVLDHAVPAFHAEIDVEVRHGYALGVQEALEQQVVFERVEVGDSEHEGDQRARAGAATGTHRYPMFLGPANEVRDDQEVSREAHVADDVQLILQPGTIRPGHRLDAVRPDALPRGAAPQVIP